MSGQEVVTGEAEGVRARFDKMYHEIRMGICLLDFPPGTKLSEEALARDFGVSRTPLRRVLARLEYEGLVQSVHGVGTLVTDVDIATMGQVYQLRMELAEMTSRLSPVEITAAQLAGMEEIARRSKEVVANPAPRAFAQLNIDFFEARIALSANEPLREISRLLYYQTSRIWLQSISAHRIELQEEAHIFDREVEDFLRALKLGDLQAATLIHRAHISMSFTRMQQNSLSDQPR